MINKEYDMEESLRNVTIAKANAEASIDRAAEANNRAERSLKTANQSLGIAIVSFVINMIIIALKLLGKIPMT